MTGSDRFRGKFRGVCRDNNDPEMRGRIRIEIPGLLGMGRDKWTVWALPCLPPGSFQVPEEGKAVFVEFINGNPNDPVWTGVFYAFPGQATSAPFQQSHAVLTDEDDVEVDWDKADHAGQPVDDAEHAVTHDHGAGEYYSPHQQGYRSHTGHVLEFNDHPGKSAYVRLLDRVGRGLRMAINGVLTILGAPADSTEWNDPSGTPAAGQHSFKMVDHKDEGTERYIELKDMAGATIKMRSTPGEEEVIITDFWGQKIHMRSENGSEFITFVDRSGSEIKLDAASGKVTITATDDVEIHVGSADNVHIGGVSGEELATRTFVSSYFNAHIHPTPMGPSGTPVVPAPLTPGSDITKKTKGE